MKKLLLVACFGLVGCNAPDPKLEIPLNRKTEDVVPLSQNRFTVTRQAEFKDDLAYGRVRGVYTIIDSKTGKEYVGVSGIGISEVGSHSNGKSSATDER